MVCCPAAARVDTRPSRPLTSSRGWPVMVEAEIGGCRSVLRRDARGELVVARGGRVRRRHFELHVLALAGIDRHRITRASDPIDDTTPGKGLLGFYLFSWPTNPVWLYRVTQGTHVTLGLTLVPILLFKLWSVLPKLFEWPPLRSPAHALERLSLFLLVGGAVFEFATGILNIQTWYPFPTSFYTLHFYGAWVFIAGFAVHVPLKLPTMIRALRSRSFWGELRTNLTQTRPEPADAGYLAPVLSAIPGLALCRA